MAIIAHSVHPDKTVLFLTANDTEEDMLEGFGVGCDDYISKPFSIEVLRKKVLAVLKRTGIGKFRMKYRDLELSLIHI